MRSSANHIHQVPGNYQLVDVLHESEVTKILLANNEKGDMCLLKTHTKNIPSDEQVSRLQHEFDITRGMDYKGLVVPKAFERNERGAFLVYDYRPGPNLKSFLKGKPQNLELFFRMSIQVTKALAKIHDQDVIHKDITPNNIIVDEVNKNRFCIIDFDNASQLSLKTSDLVPPEDLRGTLHYLSPEQTGRMNRYVDHKADLYGLGATLYEVLVGKPMFEGDDPLELVHAHLAKAPVPPSAVRKDVPPALDKIILKLLSKNAEDRYLSAYGLLHDLEQAQQLWSHYAESADFEVGQQDFSNKLSIPERLYGRENEVRRMRSIFFQAAQGSKQWVMLPGYSGSGKSSLVHELAPNVATRSALFLEGKFSQYAKNTPYSAWVQAIDRWVDGLMSRDIGILEEWKTQILDAVGNIGKVLINLFPRMEYVLGPQPEVPKLTGEEEQNRLIFAFKALMGVLATPGHPVVVFLDDLQWADGSSLRLLESILTDTTDLSLMIIGAFRNNEVPSSHPLRVTEEFVLSASKKSQYNLTASTLEVKNLGEQHVLQMLADTLHHDEDQIKELTSWVFNKTQGNPFFIKQFLRTLFEERLLVFDLEKRAWTWELEEIQQQLVADDVIALMVPRIKELPEKTQSLLQVASCMGATFTVLDLTKLLNEFTEAIQQQLFPALREGLIFPSGGSQFTTAEVSSTSVFRFAHDKILQSVYVTLDEETRQRYHLRWAKHLLDTLEESERESRIFDLVDHLNRAEGLISDPKERKQLATMNYNAGKKALQSAAFDTSYEHLKLALGYLGEDSWKKDYSLTLKIHNLLTESALDLKQFEEMEVWRAAILSEGKGDLDKLEAYLLKIQSCKALGNSNDALDVAVEALAKFGIKQGKVMRRKDIIIEFTKTKMLLGRFKDEDILSLPLMTDPLQTARSRIFSTISPVVYQSDPLLFTVMNLKHLRITLKSGLNDVSPGLYATLAMILSGAMGDVKGGTRYARITREMVDKYRFTKEEAATRFLLAFFSLHWSKSYSEVAEELHLGYKAGLETGVSEYAAYNISLNGLFHFMQGMPLHQFRKKTHGHIKIIRELNEYSLLTNTSITAQMVEHMMNPDNQETQLNGPLFNYEKRAPEMLEEQHLIGLQWSATCNMFINYFNERYSEALKWSYELMTNREDNIITPIELMGDFLSTLVFLRHKRKNSKLRIPKPLQAYRKKIRKYAKSSPDNYGHHQMVVEAEYAFSAGKIDQARKLFLTAIEATETTRRLGDRAIVWELASQFFEETGQIALAVEYRRIAYNLFSEWGLAPKVRAMQVAFPYLADASLNTANSVSIRPVRATATTTQRNTNLDVDTIIKSSQALSGEIRVEQLLEKMMHIVLENAGAERAVLLSKQEEVGWIVIAAGEMGKAIEWVANEPLVKTAWVPQSVVRYVTRTQQPLVIANASQEEGHRQDPYMLKNQPKSVLCYPVMNKGQLQQVFYLENNLATGTFTANRLEVLGMLSTQIGISLENAQLYENLEEKVRQRTQEVVSQKEIIEKKNADITASINYARRIQEAMLPPLDHIRRHIKDSFVFFQPRDIVSGDFYWFDHYEGCSIIAAIDCTGHGVPGAFMSLIGNSLLLDVVRSRGIKDPAAILEALDEGVIKMLKQRETDNRDGMDAAICVVDHECNKVRFAGAHNPLVHIHGDAINRIDGSRRGIGMNRRKGGIAFQTTELEASGSFYIFSDGYQDQFGGPQGKKYMSKRFRQLLQRIHAQPMKDQKRVLEEALLEWRGAISQIDDVLVMGFRL